MIEELERRVQNLSEVFSDPSHLVKRVDTIQTQLLQMEGQQRNTSLTMRVILDTLHNMDSYSAKNNN
jgi:hypothetical protein